MKIISTSQTVKSTEIKATRFSRKFKLVSIASVCLFVTTIAVSHPLFVVSNTELVRVLSEGDMAKIAQVFDKGVDINHDTEGDGTPLIIAVKNENKALVKYLLEHGADVNRESIKDGNPLIAAALTNNVDIVKYLYQQGAKLDAIVEHDETALISASSAGHFQVVKLLVEHGADVNLAVETDTIRGKELRSPLNGASTSEIREFLIIKGARG